MKPELSIIIVNYNGQKYLENCFNSLYENLKDISFEVIVLDNNSADESCVYIKQNYPEIVLIESQKNLGFGVGNNEAVKQAKGDYLLLINNDTIVLDNLKPVLNHLKSDNSIGVIGINMLDSNKNYIPAAANFPSIRNMFQFQKLLDLGTEFKTGKFSKKSYEVDWLSGSFLMMPKSIYNQINGFDPDYFLYVEDVDFCKRISNCGYKRIFSPNFSYIHFVGFSKSKNPMLIKGYQIYIPKHFSGIEKILVLLALNINKTVKLIKNRLNIN